MAKAIRVWSVGGCTYYMQTVDAAENIISQRGSNEAEWLATTNRTTV